MTHDLNADELSRHESQHEFIRRIGNARPEEISPNDLKRYVKGTLGIFSSVKAAILAQQQRIVELEAALDEGRRAIGDHSASDDCYATGPLTGNDYRDLIECPACSFIAKYDDARAALGSAPGADAP